jgi:hypothetical protein
MGFSVTLTHIIMVISSVTLASVFSAYALYTGNAVQNELMQNISEAKIRDNLRLEIVYATVDNSTNPLHFVIYVKNVGSLPLRDFTYLDVYVGEYGRAQLYTYDSTASVGSGQFNLTDANGDGVWEPRETATIKAYPTSNVEGVLYEAKIVPFRGIGSNYLFSPPP